MAPFSPWNCHFTLPLSNYECLSSTGKTPAPAHFSRPAASRREAHWLRPPMVRNPGALYCAPEPLSAREVGEAETPNAGSGGQTASGAGVCTFFGHAQAKPVEHFRSKHLVQNLFQVFQRFVDRKLMNSCRNLDYALFRAALVLPSSIARGHGFSLNSNKQP